MSITFSFPFYSVTFFLSNYISSSSPMVKCSISLTTRRYCFQLHLSVLHQSFLLSHDRLSIEMMARTVVCTFSLSPIANPGVSTLHQCTTCSLLEVYFRRIFKFPHSPCLICLPSSSLYDNLFSFFFFTTMFSFYICSSTASRSCCKIAQCHRKMPKWSRCAADNSENNWMRLPLFAMFLFHSVINLLFSPFRNIFQCVCELIYGSAYMCLYVWMCVCLCVYVKGRYGQRDRMKNEWEYTEMDVLNIYISGSQWVYFYFWPYTLSSCIRLLIPSFQNCLTERVVWK